MKKVFYLLVLILYCLSTVVFGDGISAHVNTSSDYLFLWGMYFVSVTFLAFLMKRGKHQHMPVLLYLWILLWTIFVLLISFSADAFYYIVIFLLGELAGRLLYYFSIKRGQPLSFDERIEKPLIFLLIIILIFCQVNTYEFNKKSGFQVAKDFNNIHPRLGKGGYQTNGSFEVTFVNPSGTTITINYVNLTETIAGQPCGNIYVNGVAYPDGHGNQKVKPGDEFQISATCPIKNKSDIDLMRFNLSIAIKYNNTMVGMSVEHGELGSLRGYAIE
jgi:hypothetical protein